MKKQVDKLSYNFQKYSFSGRWVSYFHQINEVLKLNPKSILEIGVGDKVFESYIKNNTNIDYKSIDIAEDLNPNFIGSVEKMPFLDNSFDLIVAFEILEHLPFNKFEQSLKEIKRVSRKNAIISLPHFGPPIKFLIKFPFPKEHKFNGQHYWEVGKRGYSPKKVREIIKKYFYIKKEFIPFENQYHHFYILEIL